MGPGASPRPRVVPPAAVCCVALRVESAARPRNACAPRVQGINYAPLTLNSSNASSSSSAHLAWTGVTHGLWMLANSSCPPPAHSLDAGQYGATQLVAPANDGSYTINCTAANKTGVAVSVRGHLAVCTALCRPVRVVTSSPTHTSQSPPLHLLRCRPGTRAQWTTTATLA